MPRRGRKKSLRRRSRRSQTRKAQKGGGANAATEQKTVVLVEPRRHAALEFLLRNVLENLGSTWSVLVIHGTLNKDYVEAAMNRLTPQQRERISLQSLERSVLPWAEYNKMLMTKEFYQRIPTDIFLLVQTDSMICPGTQELLQKFLQYDYVGAPWKTGGVGNGGFSLRRKSKMLEILEKCPPNPDANEDGFFSAGCAAVKASIPSPKEAEEFSIETIYAPRSFGLHKSWYHLPQVDGAMERQCRGYAQLKSLQKEE
jgi:hypothetical protein